MDYTAYGILQARILEWVAFPFSGGSSQPRDWTQVSCIASGFFTSWATREVQEYWSGLPSPSPVDLPDSELNLHCRQILLPAELWGKPINSTYLSSALVVRGWTIGKEQVSGSLAVRKGRTGTQHRTGYSWPKSKGNNHRNATLTITRFEVVWWGITNFISVNRFLPCSVWSVIKWQYIWLTFYIYLSI